LYPVFGVVNEEELKAKQKEEIAKFLESEKDSAWYKAYISLNAQQNEDDEEIAIQLYKGLMAGKTQEQIEEEFLNYLYHKNTNSEIKNNENSVSDDPLTN
jgi:hypothetical protein